jgi:hypothetical protein
MGKLVAHERQKLQVGLDRIGTSLSRKCSRLHGRLLSIMSFTEFTGCDLATSSPPFRISFRSPQWLDCSRPSSVPVATPQCHTLYLYQTARAKTTRGMQKARPYVPYNLPPPEDPNNKSTCARVPIARESQRGSQWLKHATTTSSPATCCTCALETTQIYKGRHGKYTGREACRATYSYPYGLKRAG